MWSRRLLYLGVLTGCGIFYLFYREWLSWLLLMWVLSLPIFSAVISLPAMVSARFLLVFPQRAAMGEPVTPELSMACRFPAPLLKGRLQVVHALTGESFLYELGEALQTEHCGVRKIRVWRLWVYDYLGLFRLPKKNIPGGTLTVVPSPIPMPKAPLPKGGLQNAWRPKAGGGFGENHELRLYRPGDDLRHIHWKLVAKTGNLVLREPMEPILGCIRLRLTLAGDVAGLDRRLGNLLWASGYLLDRGLKHRVECLTGQGLESFFVSDRRDRSRMLDALLGAPAVPVGTGLPPTDAPWCVELGGDGDEE